jgi:hypothetical protein
MGTFPRVQKIPSEEIVRRYVDGEGRGVLGLRAGIGDGVICAILRAAGVELRTPSQVREAVSRSRMATLARRRPRR